MPLLKYNFTFAGRNMSLSFSGESPIIRGTQLTAKPTEGALANSAAAGELAFKTGLGLCDNQAIEWLDLIKSKTVPGSNATLQAVDANGKVVQQWSLKNAKPLHIDCLTPKPDDKEIHIVELVITHEGIASGDGTSKGGGSHW